jgi:uncharacterized protein (TIGR03067 family)
MFRTSFNRWAFLAVSCLLCVTAVVAGEQPSTSDKDDRNNEDLGQLQGTWTVIESVNGGKPQLPGRGPKAAEFKNGKLTLDMQRGPRVFEVAIKSRTSPAQIDLKTTVDGKVETIRGIYEIGNDEVLLLCIPHNSNAKRPGDFKTSGQVHLLRLQKGALARPVVRSFHF